MKLRLTLIQAEVGMSDVTLSCDVTQTVSETARTLVRANAGADPHLQSIAEERFAPLTLVGRPTEAAPPVMLDPGATIGASGLQSGWIIEPVAEFGPWRDTERVLSAAGYVEVLSGRQSGVFFSLVLGENLIGRDRGARVHLSDPSVSRRHASIEVRRGADAGIVLHDLGSANGLVVDGVRVVEHLIEEPCLVQLGEIRLRITPGPPPPAPPHLTHQMLHTRSPRVGPRFAHSERELPAPPPSSSPNRIPLLAMLAPMMMGGVLYAVTQSPMSLLMVGFTPLMMIGSWLDGRLSGRRKKRGDMQRFDEILAAERQVLTELRDSEAKVRAEETPAFAEIAAAITGRSSLLWVRRPEHRAFLELRFGEGVLPSRTRVKLPARADATAEHWQALTDLEAEFAQVAEVPVLEQLERCGSIGVAGEPYWAEGIARSLVVQLAGLHSPAELALAGFVGPDDSETWEWLKWLPHVDSVTSPVPCWPLADDAPSAIRLVTALEGLLETRRALIHTRASVRSHLDTVEGDDRAKAETVTALPVTPAVVVLVLDGQQGDTARLIALAEQGPDAGIFLIWVARERAQIPAACRTFAELGHGAGSVSFVRSGDCVPLTRLEHADAGLARELARRLAPVEDMGARALDESDLPTAVNLCELHPVDLLGGPESISQAWMRSGTITSQWVSGVDREPVSLAAVVGQGPDGPSVIDLRVHGPHALVGGTTGAGKSEFLQSWIMSMAAGISPDRLTFLLVDYKGGAAFAECTDLPHTVGLVTDLSPHLVRRVLTSLRAELRYREALLAEHGAKDLITLERRSDPAAPPVLVIVIDEFAALATEIPEFVDGVIDVAQRGRSLGLHLIMATQRPAGVIKDNLRANTNLRVALRMADEADSSDVIGVKDAAFFGVETPGRGAIKVGPGRIAHFQTGYLGSRASGPAIAPSRLELRPLGFTEGCPIDLPPEPEGRVSRSSARDIEVLRDGIIAAATGAGLAKPRRPWLDVLPEQLALEVLETYFDLDHGARDHTDGAVVGLRDKPSEQLQSPVIVNLDEAGSIAIIGASGTGKTSALITMAAALSTTAAANPVQIYAIDAAGGALDALRPLPTVGAVAPLSDLELTGRLLRRVLEQIGERGPRYAAARASGLRAYRQVAGAPSEPRILLIIDGLAAFRQETETVGGPTSLFQMLGEIMANGRSVGVHVVLTSDRPSAVPAAMASTLQQQYVFRLASPHDYGYLGVAGDVLEDAPPGRALLVGSDDEVQFALVGGEPALAAQASAIERLAPELDAQGVSQTPEVCNAPVRVELGQLPIVLADRATYGIDTLTLEAIGMPVRGLGVIAGPTGSGLSTAALTCVAALQRFAVSRNEPFDTVLLTLVPNGLRVLHRWGRVAHGEEAVRDLARELTIALGGKPAGRGSFASRSGPIEGLVGAPIGVSDGGSVVGKNGTASGTEVPGGVDQLRFPHPGARSVVVVERPAEAEGTEAIAELVALAKAARRADTLVLFEFEQGTGAGIWDLFAALKQPAWGLALQPDEGESQSPFRETFGRVKRADFPPGRGFAIESGRVTPVQVAVPIGLLNRVTDQVSSTDEPGTEPENRHEEE